MRAVRERWLVAAATVVVGAVVFSAPSVKVQAAAADPASVAAFMEVAKVLNHPRCMNCHTNTDWPTQGDDKHRHTFNVVRGKDDKGAVGMRCTTCHTDKNQDAAGVPGAKDWHMATKDMGWIGLTPGVLCRSLLDPKKNGGRSGDKVIEHMRGDRLVLWAWTPGGKRKAPDVPHAAFIKAAETWIAKGAACPP